MAAFAPEIVHRRLLAEARPALAFDAGQPLARQGEPLRAKLAELLAVPTRRPPAVTLAADDTRDGVRERRLVVTAEPGAEVPCHLLTPAGAGGTLPLAVCLQGHTPGMHISLGRPRDEAERRLTEGGRDYARQALAHGWAALTVELRGFGERRDRRTDTARDGPVEPDSVDPNVTCKHAAMVALLLGRTSLGEKNLDLRAALDALEGFPEIDRSRIWCIGNSGGGTLGWYAAAVEPRIAGLALGSFLCTFAASIGSVDHCCDNYLPGALRWFDLPDLAMLVAPRPLVVVQGAADRLFPLAGVETAFARVRAIYAAARAADRCRLMVCRGGHRFYAEEAWGAVRALTAEPSRTLEVVAS